MSDFTAAIAASAIKLSERDFLQQVVEYAHLRGWLVHHCRPAVLPSGKWATHIQGDAGFCDLTMARDGRVVFAELKSEKGRVSEGQQAWIDTIDPDGDYSGHNVYVFRPSDWDSIVEILK